MLTRTARTPHARHSRCITAAAARPQAIFNFVIAWAVMFVPVILTDAASKKVSNKAAWCTAIAFTTNIAFFPFLALRAAPERAEPGQPRPPRPAPGGTQAVPAWGRFTGGACLTLCALSVAFAFVGRPEMAGGLAERADYLCEEFGSNRVSCWAALGPAVDLGS